MAMPEKVIIPASKDPGKGHFYISLVKSAVRIFAGIFLLMLLVTVTAGCYGTGACPEGHCNEANSPTPPEK